MVNAAPDFTDHPEVINGFSDLMIEVFGKKGKQRQGFRWDGITPQEYRCRDRIDHISGTVNGGQSKPLAISIELRLTSVWITQDVPRC